MDFQQKLHRIGQTAFAWSDTHIALTSAALLQPGDVAIGIPHTGVTTDTIDARAQARRSGATTVALTNFPRSPIVEVADHVLTTAVRETTFRSGAMASRLAQLTLVDFHVRRGGPADPGPDAGGSRGDAGRGQWSPGQDRARRQHQAPRLGTGGTR